MTLSSSSFRDHFHACAFVNGLEDEESIIDPFLLDGIRHGEKAVYIVDPAARKLHENRLSSRTSDRELLEVKTWNEAHLQGGSFDRDRMIGTLDVMLQEHAQERRPPMRLVGQMGWVFSSPPGIEQLIDYEATVNEVLNRHRTPTVCVYDVRRLSGSMMMDLLRTHPIAVMNGVLQENPFYTPPDVMLQDLQQRRSAT
ncbi:MAG TPA: MEDS domain-containing protein [Polyangiaceae bacterium]